MVTIFLHLFVFNRKIVTFVMNFNAVGMTVRVREVADLIVQNGWKLVRIRGDHRVYYKEGARRPIVIPGNLNDDLAIGTLKSILRESGLHF